MSDRGPYLTGEEWWTAGFNAGHLEGIETGASMMMAGIRASREQGHTDAQGILESFRGVMASVAEQREVEELAAQQLPGGSELLQ